MKLQEVDFFPPTIAEGKQARDKSDIRTNSVMTLEEAIELYRTIGNRKPHLFHWVHGIYSRIHLPCVSPEYKEILALDKTKMAIFDVIADDLADNYASRNGTVLEELLSIPWNSKTGTNKIVEVGSKLWEDCMRSISDYPRFKDFERIFYFDLRQVVSGMEYSYLVNTVGMDNPIDNRVHLPHGCMVVLHCDLDLMCSPKFDMADLGNIRMLFHFAQRVAHIGNMLSTYPREVVENDLSCPIISESIRIGVIKKDELGKESIVPRLRLLEAGYKDEAENCIRKARKYEKRVQSVDMTGFSTILCQLFSTFIAMPQNGTSLTRN